MNTERPLIRPFKNLDDLERIVSGINLKVVSTSRAETMESGDVFRCDFLELRSLGISILFNAEVKDMAKAISKLGLNAEMVSTIVIIDSSFLRNREVIELGLVTDLTATYDLALINAQRDEVLMDRRHGFDVYVQFILANEITPKPLTPYRKGTELARAVFSVKPLPDGDGLSPQPLDEETRRRLKLPATTEFFVEVDPPLLEMESFEGNLTIWMNEELYDLCITQKSKYSERYLENAAINALIQIVYMISVELRDLDPAQIEANPPMVINVLRDHFKTLSAGTLIDQSGFVSVLKSSPEKIAAVLSGFGGNVKNWKLVLDSDEQEVGDNQ
jgi:hypothetical protein